MTVCLTKLSLSKSTSFFFLLYLVTLHQNVYGSTNYISSEIKLVCNDAVIFVNIFQNIFSYKTFI